MGLGLFVGKLRFGLVVLVVWCVSVGFCLNCWILGGWVVSLVYWLRLAHVVVCFGLTGF